MKKLEKNQKKKKVNIGTRWLPRTLSDFKNGISVSGLGLDNGVRKVTLSFGDQKMSGIFIEPEVSLVRTKFILTYQYINIDFYNSTTSPIMLYFQDMLQTVVTMLHKQIQQMIMCKNDKMVPMQRKLLSGQNVTV